MPKPVKRLVSTIIIATLTVMASSLVFNKPIHISRATAAANTQAAGFPAQAGPDHIILSPAGDMAESVNISWRASSATAGGVVEYQPADENDGSPAREATAVMTRLESPELTADNTIHCFAATLDKLRPGTTYRYRVGDKSAGRWSEYQAFTTASNDGRPFSFVYLGDTQTNGAEFGRMLAAIDRQRPEAAFYMIAGDLVDDGSWRNMWDALLSEGQSVYGSKPLVPALGNHEYLGQRNAGPDIYKKYFNLPGNGGAAKNRYLNYSFTYERAYFIVLNSNLSISSQNQWLESELRKAGTADRDFIIVMFHHPPYTMRGGLGNQEIQDNWIPLFDKYNVDLVLNGHEHSYMRTRKMRNHRAVDGHEPGTTYIVATACEKFHKTTPSAIAERQVKNVVTYQVISVEADNGGGPVLKYKSFDFNDNLMDEVVIGSSGKDKSRLIGARNYSITSPYRQSAATTTQAPAPKSRLAIGGPMTYI